MSIGRKDLYLENLSEQARKARNEYVRNWRARNKEKVRKSNELYWERRAKRITDQDILIKAGEHK